MIGRALSLWRKALKASDLRRRKWPSALDSRSVRMAAESDPSEEDIASWTFGGQRPRPRKNIPMIQLENKVYTKPQASLKTKFKHSSIAIDLYCCKHSTLCVLDATDQVHISDCEQCTVVIGPCTGSVFIQNCKDSTFHIAAKQTRLRDVYNSTLSVFAPNPEAVVLESSHDISIRAFGVAYEHLAAQFQLVGWEAGQVNHWDKIYDFTPPAAGEESHYQLMSVEQQAKERWIELQVLTDGTVSEKVSADASTFGCECPCLAADETKYEAPWYHPTSPPATVASPIAACSVDLLESHEQVATSEIKVEELAACGFDFGRICRVVLGWLGLGRVASNQRASKLLDSARDESPERGSTSCILQ